MSGLPSRTVYRGDAFAIGTFRCRPGEPRFRDSGPTGGNLLVFPREAVAIQHAGRPEVIADPTTVMIYNAGQAYTRRAISPAGDRCEWFAFGASMVLEARHAHGRGSDDVARPFGATMHARADAATYLLARRALEHAGSAGVDPTWLDEACATLLDRVIRGAHDAPPLVASRAHTELAHAATDLLARRFTEPLSLAALAGLLGVSTFHLARVFRAVTGRTIHHHRTELRLRAGLERIADGEPLATLAFALGFSSHSHFTQAFRAAFRIRPSALRRARS
jgi:AraC-like DNA-binding protein